jgi:hypothetical protein
MHSPDQSAQTVDPGTCNCHPTRPPCPCPGWKYWAPDEWQLEMQMEQGRVDRAFGRSLETLYEADD